MEVLRRKKFLSHTRDRLSLLQPATDGTDDAKKAADAKTISAYRLLVSTVSLEATALEALNDRSKLPALHIMQGPGLVRHAGPHGGFGSLGDTVEYYPVLIRGTVKGPSPEDPPGSGVIPAKDDQMLDLMFAVERLLVGTDITEMGDEEFQRQRFGGFLGIAGVEDVALGMSLQPRLREDWGTPWSIIEFHYLITHVFRKGEVV